MKFDIRYKPAFATIFITLDPGEKMTAEAGSMVSMDADLSVKTTFSGGFFSALLKKCFGGESLFVNTFINTTQFPRQLVLSQLTPGDIVAVELSGKQQLCFQPGAYIASTPDVKLGIGWAGISSWFAGEGLFKLKVKGSGTVFFGAYGGISQEYMTLDLIVDNGHLVAYEDGIKMGVGLAGGVFGSITSGEGFINRLKGKGTVYLQSRSQSGLVKFLSPKCR